ncbi:MAG: putative quinol monooxygenase [Bryobacteraceae bacterium]
MNPRSRHAQARQIFVITHVDIDPQFVPQAQPLLNTFVADSLNNPGVQTFALLSQTPTPNHFQLIETFEDPGGIRRPRERAAYGGLSDGYGAVLGCAVR